MNIPPHATYQRYKAKRKIEGDSRRAALTAYVAHYAEIARTNPGKLNQKLPKKCFDALLSEVGGLVQLKAKKLAANDGPLKTFLAENPVPACLGNELADEVRAFCLILNALRQWAVSEQLAMDRLLLTGNVRKELKELYSICPVSPDDTDATKIELHHPLRDGRPPIPLSKTGHDIVEGILVIEDGDSDGAALVAFRREYGPVSWKRIRVGCLVALNSAPEGMAKTYINSSRTWLNKAKRVTRLDETKILAFLDRYELGLLEE